jgi:hypothetical protein
MSRKASKNPRRIKEGRQPARRGIEAIRLIHRRKIIKECHRAQQNKWKTGGGTVTTSVANSDVVPIGWLPWSTVCTQARRRPRSPLRGSIGELVGDVGASFCVSASDGWSNSV